MKPGYLTTEFYMVALSLVIDGLTALTNNNVYASHPALARDVLIVQTVLVSVYALCRSIVKAFSPDPTPDSTTPIG